MCGIAGFARVGADREPSSVLERMTCAIRHRGPDDFGYYVDPYVALGHRRLSIIDLAAGHQPMTNEDGSAWIVYNGEIFNHADLRPELEQAGHRYTTRCDTETILHAYEEYGADCVTALPRHVCVRDLGQRRRDTVLRARPAGHQAVLLLLGWATVRLRFGDQGAAGASGDLGRVRRASSFAEYLAFGYTSGERTMFSGIRKLMPGHTALQLDATTEP